MVSNQQTSLSPPFISSSEILSLGVVVFWFFGFSEETGIIISSLHLRCGKFLVAKVICQSTTYQNFNVILAK